MSSASTQVRLPRDAGELESCLLTLTVANNEAVASATSCLKLFLKSEGALAPMMQQLMASSRVEARHLSAILLRQKIRSYWKRIDAAVKEQLKAALLDRLRCEPEKVVRTSIAALISTVAKIAFHDGEWNALLQFLLELINSDQTHLKQIAMTLFRALAENIRVPLKPHFRTLQAIFTRGLGDADEKVRVNSLYALAALVDLIDSDENDSAKHVTYFRESVGPLLHVTAEALKNRNEDVLNVCLEVIEMLTIAPVPLLDAHLPMLIHIFLDAAGAHSLDLAMRDKAANLLIVVIDAQPNKLFKANLVEPIMRMAVGCVCEDSDVNPFDSGGQTTAQGIGVDIVDKLVTVAPKSAVFPPMLAMASDLISNTAEPLKRKAGLLSLAVLADTAGELTRMHLDKLVPVIASKLEDPHQLVRLAACVALQQFSDYLQPEMSQMHAQFIPQLLNLLSVSSESMLVKQYLFSALDAFCEGSEDDTQHLDAYHQSIMTHAIAVLHAADPAKLIAMAQHVAAHNNSDTEEELKRIINVEKRALACIRSVADSLRNEKFLPYYQATASTLFAFMTISLDHAILAALRAHATEAMGAVAQAVGREHFAVLLKECVNAAAASLNSDLFEVRECAFFFFACLAAALKDAFQPLLEDVTVRALDSCLSDDGLRLKDGNVNELDEQPDRQGFSDSDNDEEQQGEVTNEDEENANAEVDEHGSAAKNDETDGDIVLDDNNYRTLDIAIHSGAIEEKVAAVGCLKYIVQHVGEPFIPFLKKSMQVMDEFSEYPHVRVRHANVQLVHGVLSMLHKFAPPASAPSKNNPRPEIPLQATPFVIKLVSILVERLGYEEDLETTGIAADALVFAIKDFGFGCITDEGWKILCTSILRLLQERAPCQRPQDDKEDHTIIQDHDEFLIDSVTDLLTTIVQIGGSAMEPTFEKMYAPLKRFFDDARPSSDRSMVIGTLGEVCPHLGSAFQKYLPDVVRLCMKAMEDPSLAVRRNAVYLYGNLVSTYSNERGLTSLYPQIIQRLQQLYKIPSDINAANRAYIASQAQHRTAQGKAKNGQLEELWVDEKFEEKDFYGARDNAVSTLGKMIVAAPNELPIKDAVRMFMDGLPIRNDFEETKNILSTIVFLYTQQAAAITEFTPHVLFTFACLLGNPQIDATVQVQATEFCKQLCQQIGQQASEAIINDISEPQKSNLLKFLTAAPPEAVPPVAASASSASA